MILYYPGTSQASRKQLEEILKLHGQSIREIDDHVLDEKLKDLIKSQAQFEYNETFTWPEFLFYGDMEMSEIQAIEKDLRDAGIRIWNKASSTPANLDWKLSDLFEEVAKEAEYFKSREELYKLIAHPDQDLIETDEQYLKTMATAYSVLKSPEADLDMIRLAIKAVKEYEK